MIVIALVIYASTKSKSSQHRALGTGVAGTMIGVSLVQMANMYALNKNQKEAAAAKAAAGVVHPE